MSKNLGQFPKRLAKNTFYNDDEYLTDLVRKFTLYSMFKHCFRSSYQFTSILIRPITCFILNELINQCVFYLASKSSCSRKYSCLGMKMKNLLEIWYTVPKQNAGFDSAIIIIIVIRSSNFLHSCFWCF